MIVPQYNMNSEHIDRATLEEEKKKFKQYKEIKTRQIEARHNELLHEQSLLKEEAVKQKKEELNFTKEALQIQEIARKKQEVFYNYFYIYRFFMSLC